MRQKHQRISQRNANRSRRCRTKEAEHTARPARLNFHQIRQWTSSPTTPETWDPLTKARLGSFSPNPDANCDNRIPTCTAWPVVGLEPCSPGVWTPDVETYVLRCPHFRNHQSNWTHSTTVTLSSSREWDILFDICPCDKSTSHSEKHDTLEFSEGGSPDCRLRYSDSSPSTGSVDAPDLHKAQDRSFRPSLLEELHALKVSEMRHLRDRGLRG